MCIRDRETKEPRIVTPEIALLPDIKGVWSKEGTSLITLYPSQVETKKTTISQNAFIICATPYLYYKFAS